MQERTIAKYGSWISPVTPEAIAYGSNSIGYLVQDGADIYCTENRPAEGGRVTLLKITEKGPVEILPREFSALSRVHEYGGRCVSVSKGRVFFSNQSDQILYLLVDGSGAIPVSAKGGRFADFVVDEKRQGLFSVFEDHSKSGSPQNSIVFQSFVSPYPMLSISEGYDFYSNPRLSADGDRLLWLCWNHPNMPWDGCELWTAELDESGNARDAHLVAGGEEESLFQPEWSVDGKIYFVTDRNGWWNIHFYDGTEVRPLVEMEAEFGRAPFVLGLRTYAPAGGGKIACAYSMNGSWSLGIIDVDSHELRRLDIPFNDISDICSASGHVYVVAGGFGEERMVIALNEDMTGYSPVYRSRAPLLEQAYISLPEHIEFTNAGGQSSYALYYPPTNPEFIAVDGEKPPLIVMSHGGPTDQARPSLDSRIQFWTTRGFAVVDVNYRGSTGYGRHYRTQLNGMWGVADVEDCSGAASALAARGLADANRLFIRGGSAGGFTTLCALASSAIFRGGASYFGVSDLEALARDTHKFESRYLDRLVGPYPEKRDTYARRSPVNHAENISCPVIFFQGLEDRVVPPSQSEKMVKVLKGKGIPVLYVTYKGESHGFRMAENIRDSLERELLFYQGLLES